MPAIVRLVPVSFVLALVCINATLAADHRMQPLEVEGAQINTKSKNLIGFSLFKRYASGGDHNSFKGRRLSSLWVTDGVLHSVDFSLSESLVEVASPVKPSNAQRVWDLEYSWQGFSDSREVSGFYWMPSLGVRYQENMKVVCTRLDTYCFDIYSNDWERVSKTSEIRPLLGLKYGLRLAIRRLMLKGEVQLLSDTSNEFAALSLSLYYEH
jgi:hypothetical protein